MNLHHPRSRHLRGGGRRQRRRRGRAAEEQRHLGQRHRRPGWGQPHGVTDHADPAQFRRERGPLHADRQHHARMQRPDLRPGPGTDHRARGRPPRLRRPGQQQRRVLPDRPAGSGQQPGRVPGVSDHDRRGRGEQLMRGTGGHRIGQAGQHRGGRGRRLGPRRQQLSTPRNGGGRAQAGRQGDDGSRQHHQRRRHRAQEPGLPPGGPPPRRTAGPHRQLRPHRHKASPVMARS